MGELDTTEEYRTIDALDIIKEPIRKSTLGYFQHKVTKDLYEGPCHISHDHNSDIATLRIWNNSTSNWEFLNLEDLRHLEKIKGIDSSYKTRGLKPIPYDENELKKLANKIDPYGHSNKPYTLQEIINFKNIEGRKRLDS